MKEYRTAQKEKILDFMREHSDRSYTAEELAAALSEDGKSPVGKSTVYRRIPRLVESGAVKRFESPERRAFVYQYAGMDKSCETHFHLRCTVCGKLAHTECDELELLKEHILAEHGFLIGGSAIINGVCRSCDKRLEAK